MNPRQPICLEDSGASMALGVLSFAIGAIGLLIAGWQLGGASLAAGLSLLAGILLWRSVPWCFHHWQRQASYRLEGALDEPSQWFDGRQKYAVQRLSITRLGRQLLVTVEIAGGHRHMLAALPADPVAQSRICAWIMWVSGRSPATR